MMYVLISIISLASIVLLLKLFYKYRRSQTYDMLQGLQKENEGQLNEAILTYEKIFSGQDYLNNTETVEYDAFIRYSSCILKTKSQDKISNWLNNYYSSFVNSPNCAKKDDVILEYTLLMMENKQFYVVPNLIENHISRESKSKAKAYLDYSVEQIKISANKIIEFINNHINDPASLLKILELMHSNSDILALFPEQFEQIKKIEPSIINRLLVANQKSFDYLKFYRIIVKQVGFLGNPRLLNNAAILADKICAEGKLTAANYKEIISTFLVAAFNDIIFIQNLEETEWDDNYHFDFTNSTGYNPNKGTVENATGDNGNIIDINNTRNLLIDEFKNQLNTVYCNDKKFINEIDEFFNAEIKAIMDLNSEILNEIVLGESKITFTPYFGKKMNLIPKLLRDITNNSHPLSIEDFNVLLPYLLIEYEIDLSSIDITNLKYTLSDLSDSSFVERNLRVITSIHFLKNSIRGKRIDLLKELDKNAKEALKTAKEHYLSIVSNELKYYLNQNNLSKEGRIDICKLVYELLPQSKEVARSYSNEITEYAIYLLQQKHIKPVECYEKFEEAYKIDRQNYYVQKNILQLLREFSIIWAAETKLAYLLKDLDPEYELKKLIYESLRLAFNDFQEYERMSRMKGEFLRPEIINKVIYEFKVSWEYLYA